MTADAVTILVVDDNDAGRYVKAHILASRGLRGVRGRTRTRRHRSGKRRRRQTSFCCQSPNALECDGAARGAVTSCGSGLPREIGRLVRHLRDRTAELTDWLDVVGGSLIAEGGGM